MKLYNYKCVACEHEFEQITKGPCYDWAKCPECKRTAERICSGFAASGGRRDHTILEE